MDEATLDIITVMLVRNCKLTPADVEVMAVPHIILQNALPCSPTCFSFFQSVKLLAPWLKFAGFWDGCVPVSDQWQILLPSVHTAPRQSTHCSASVYSPPILPALAPSCGLLLTAEPADLPAHTQVYRQQCRESLQGECVGSCAEYCILENAVVISAFVLLLRDQRVYV